MADNPDIRIIVGVKGGGEVSGESAVLIKKELHSIAKKLSAVEHCPKITIRVDEGSTKKAIQNQLNKISKGLKITIGGFEKDNGSSNGSKKGKSSDSKEYLETLKSLTQIRKEKANVIKKNGDNKNVLKALEAEESRLQGVANELERTIKLTKSLNAAKQKANIAKAYIADATTDKQSKADLEEYKANLEKIKQLEIDRYNGESIKESDISDLRDKNNLLRESLELSGQIEKVNKADAAYQKSLEKATLGKAASSNEIALAKKNLEALYHSYGEFKGNPNLLKQFEELVARAQEIRTKSDLKAFNKDVEAFGKEIEIAGRKTKSFGQQIKDAFAQYTYLFSLVGIFRTIKRITKEMVANVKEVDSAMIELRKVTDESENAYDKFLSGASEKSKQLHTNLSDVVNATADFARIGYDIDNASVLAEAAIIYSNVGDEIDSIDDASNSLISSMKAFKGFEADPMAIVDKFNEVSNNFAISSGGIGEALQRSASSFATAGNTLDEAIALITAANTVVQNPESVGTAFKTMTMRIRGSTTELEAAGEEVDEYVKSASKMREEIQNLTGVDIMKDESTYKNTYQILQEISKVFGDLADVDKANVLEILFGKRQGNIGSALLDNFNLAEEALESSMGAAGSAVEEFAKWTDSIEAKTQRFQAAYQSLSVTVINSDLVKFIVDSGTTILSILDKITGAVGALPTVGTLFGGILGLRGAGLFGYDSGLNGSGIKGTNAYYNFITPKDLRILESMNTVLKSATRESKDFQDSFEKLGPIAKSASLRLDGTKESLDGIIDSTVNFKSIGKALIGGLINAGIAAFVSFVIAAITKTITAAKEAREEAAALSNEYKSEASSIEEYESRLNELRAITDDVNSSQEEAYNARREIITIQDEIIKKYKLEAGAIDLLNGSLKDNIALLDEQAAEEYLSELGPSQKKKVEDYFSDEDSITINRWTGKIDEDIVNAIGSENLSAYNSSYYSDPESTITDLVFTGTIDERLEKMRKVYENLRQLNSDDTIVADIMEEIREEISGIVNSEDYRDNSAIRDSVVSALLSTDYVDQYSDAEVLQMAYSDALASGNQEAIQKAAADMKSYAANFVGDGMNVLVKQYFEDMFDGWSSNWEKYDLFNSDGTKEAFGSGPITSKSKAELSALRTGVIEGSAEDLQLINAIQRAADSAGISFDQALDYYEEYGYIIGPTTQKTIEFSNAQQRASAAIKGISKDYDILNQSIEDMSAEQLKELIEKYPELKDELDEFSDGAKTATEVQKEMNEIFKEERAEDLAEGFENLVDTFKQYNEINGDVQDEIDSLIYEFPGLEDAFNGVTEADLRSTDALYEYLTAAINAQLIAAQADYARLVDEIDSVGVASTEATIQLTGLYQEIAKLEESLAYLTNRKPAGSSGGGGGNSSILSKEYEEASKLADHYIELSELTQERMKEGSEEWIAESEKQYEHTQKKAELIAKELDRLAAKGYDETNEEFAKLRREYEKTQNALYDIAEGIWEAQRDYQIDALESQIDSYNKQKEQIEKLMDAEEKRWEEREEQLEYEISMQEALIDAMETYFDLQGSFRAERAELASQLAQSAMSEALYGGTNYNLDSMFSESDYDTLTSKLDQIAGEADALYEDVLTQINDVTKDNVDQLDIITESFQRQYELKLKEYEVAKQELAVARARKELENVMSERNVAMLVNGMWTWVADSKAVEDAVEAVNEAEADSIEAVTELAEAQRLAILEDTLAGIETQKIVEEAAHEKIMEGYEQQLEAIEEQIEILENEIDMLEELEFVIDDFIGVMAGGVEGLRSLLAKIGAASDKVEKDIDAKTKASDTEDRWGLIREGSYKEDIEGFHKDGGVVGYTGLAKLHGSHANPEVVFNSADAAKLYHLVHNTPDLVKSIVGSILPVGVSAPKIAKMFGIGNASTDNSKIVQVGNITLNKEDSASIISILDRVIPTM